MKFISHQKSQEKTKTKPQKLFRKSNWQKKWVNSISSFNSKPITDEKATHSTEAVNVIWSVSRRSKVTVRFTVRPLTDLFRQCYLNTVKRRGTVTADGWDNGLYELNYSQCPSICQQTDICSVTCLSVVSMHHNSRLHYCNSRLHYSFLLFFSLLSFV